MFARAFLAVGVTALLAGCGGGDRRTGGGTLRVDLVGDPADAITAATQQGLTTFDAAGEVVPGLASSWRISDDGLSVIFRLRPAVWADGRAVTANDVVAVLRRVAAPASRNPLRSLLAGLENGAAVTAGTRPPRTLGVEAPVDNVVEVRLAGAMPELLQLLAQPELAIIRAGANPPAIGPFERAVVVAPVEPGSVRPIGLAANPRYHGAAAVTLGSIVVTPAADPATAIARFARDRTDIVTGGGLAGFADARLSGSDTLKVEPSWGVYGYVANTARGPLADREVRRALAMAIDRDDLGSRLFGVALTPVLGLVPALPAAPVAVLPDWAIAEPAARLERARGLLAAAGFTPEKPLSVTISLPDAREHAAVAAEVANDWAAVGVRTLTVTRTASRHAAAIQRGRYELALVERRAPVDTPLFFLAPFACRAAPGGYCNPDADARLAEARVAADPAARAAALAAAETAMVADAPMIPLFTPVRWSLVARRVTGWTANPGGRHPLARLGIARGQELRDPSAAVTK